MPISQHIFFYFVFVCKIQPSLAESAESDIQCYNLPYGGIGFLSHLLTYYSFVCIGMGVKALYPRKPLKHSLFDLILAIIGLLMSTTIAIVAMARCRREWQFLLIALWKLTLSLTLGSMSIHRCFISRFGRETKPSRRPFVWVVVYCTGTILGLTGLISLVAQDWQMPAVRQVTAAFWGVAGIATLVFAMFPEKSVRIEEIVVEREIELDWATWAMSWFVEVPPQRQTHFQRRESWKHDFPTFVKKFVSVAVMFISVFAALYSDWILGIISGNLLGAPEGISRFASFLYWGYFAAKRLFLLFQ